MYHDRSSRQARRAMLLSKGAACATAQRPGGPHKLRTATPVAFTAHRPAGIAPRRRLQHRRHPAPAPAAGGDGNNPQGGGFGDDWLNWSPYTYPFNLTGQPAASVPCGLAGNGLPIGAQLVGRLGEDALVLRASRAIEQAGLLVSLNYLDNIKS